VFKWLPFSPVFDLVEEIGEGTFSTVYLAARRGSTARVALKHLVPTSKPARIAMEVECMEKGSTLKTISRYCPFIIRYRLSNSIGDGSS
jgi:hypothetical protein